MKRNPKHAVILTTILTLLLLAGCASNEEEIAKVDEVETQTEAAVEAEVETVVKAEVVTEEIVEETSTETVDMVDWETWATNTENEDIRLAVWNETTGTQELLEQGTRYTIQEGDKFAIAHRDTIEKVNLEQAEISATEGASGSYYEIPAEQGRVVVFEVIDAKPTHTMFVLLEE